MKRSALAFVLCSPQMITDSLVAFELVGTTLSVNVDTKCALGMVNADGAYELAYAGLRRFSASMRNIVSSESAKKGFETHF